MIPIPISNRGSRITFILSFLKSRKTQIPERLTLISINDHEEQGFHLWTFTIKDPDTLTPEESLEISNQLHQIFPFDPEASLEMPLIWSTLVMVTVPFTC